MDVEELGSIEMKPLTIVALKALHCILKLILNLLSHFLSSCIQLLRVCQHIVRNKCFYTLDIPFFLIVMEHHSIRTKLYQDNLNHSFLKLPFF